ncbi:MAG: serine protease, partial [Caulobacterales bacterium]
MSFRLFIALLTALVFAPLSHAQSGVDRAETSTVRVAVIVEAGEARTLIGTGSGFVVSQNLVVTNAHVVAPARMQDGATVVIVAPGGDGMVPARIVSYSALSDLALLEFRGGSRLAPLTIYEAEPRPGEAIVALGYPDVDDLRRPPDDLLQPTAPSRTTGAIASLRDTAPTGDPVPTINHEAAISSGSSGGPLLDECGRVIGVNTWHARGRDTLESRGVATRAEQLISFLQDAGVRATQTSARCLTVAERAEAERVSTVEALEVQNRELAAKLEAADRLTRTALVILMGGTVSLLIAVIVLGAIVFGRRSHALAPEHHSESHPVSLRRGAPGVLAVVGGATIAAVLVVSAGIAIWRVQGLGAAPTAVDVFSGEQICALDREASAHAGRDEQDVS